MDKKNIEIQKLRKIIDYQQHIINNLEHDSMNFIHHNVKKNSSVERQLRHAQFFAKRTWNDFEISKQERTVLVFTEKRNLWKYTERYPDDNAIIFDVLLENWSNIEQFLKNIQIDNSIIFINTEKWEYYVSCIEMLTSHIDNIYVFKFMEHDINEEEQKQKTWEQIIADNKNKRIFLVTLNTRCKEFVKHYKNNFNIAAIISSKKDDIGKDFEGFPIISLNDIPHDKDNIFILCSVNWNDYINILKFRGFKNIYSLRILLHMNKYNILSSPWMNILSVGMNFAFNKANNIKEIQKIQALLFDTDSKLTMQHIIEQRMTGNDDWQYIMLENETFDPPYFSNNFFSFGNDEVYLDVGPYDGNTIEMFIERVGGRYKKIIAMEINEKYFNKLEKKYNNNSRIEVLHYGAWNENKNLHVIENDFSTTLSTLNLNKWKKECACIKIDEIDSRITLIKMDIEGAEYNAILGAQQTIRKYKPKMAISIYHKCEDLYLIPNLILNLVPDYKIFIRHHKTRPLDTVLYVTI